MSTAPFLRLSVALLLLLATTVFAADDEKDNTDFLLNVFSDIGPILALFGEQFARQFLSETFTWEDHIIFACIPLGIITAIAGAIRVQGGGLFKAVIGRARENHAAAEIEYMSSTSTEVCELYNGEAILRTMGTPYIGQIIVCPDQFSNGPERDDKENSCGIHTLETAKKKGIMDHQDYQSESRPNLFKWFSPSPTTTDAIPVPNVEPPRDLESGTARGQDVVSSESHGSYQETSHEPQIPLVELLGNSGRNGARQGTPLHGRSSSDKQMTSRNLTLDGQNSEKKNPWLTLKSPNLQLNIPCADVSEKNHHYHLVLAAVVALTLQLALLVIAVSTVYFIAGFEPEPWGLPCYLGGSVLLFLGMLACSVAIEKRTRELVWFISNRVDNSGQREEFHLIWVQRNQRVSEQDFGSYIIDGGTRRQVMTSSRHEDLEGLEKPDHTANEPANVQAATANTSSSQPKGGGRDPKLPLLLLLPLVAVLFGGTGFTVQFIGLRGLPWPCAISQLGAMIIMAIIRALIRRRLTKTLKHHCVLEKHELDYLAIQLVEQNGKIFHDEPEKNQCSAQGWDIRSILQYALSKMVRTKSDKKQKPSTEVLVWKVDTASDVTFKSHKQLDADPASKKDELVFKPRDITTVAESNFIMGSTDNHDSQATHTDEGQRAILVRKRLGDLCKWPNGTSKSALALTLSIERFMKEFFPRGLPANVNDKLTLKIPFTRSHEPDKKTHNSDYATTSWVKLDVTRDFQSNGWNADNGQIEAILSLWMAHWTARRADHLETDRDKDNVKDQYTDWRRAGDGSHVEYCRRIGENRNGVLNRDISWWVNNAVEGLQSESPTTMEGQHDDASSGRKDDRFHIGFNCVKPSSNVESPDGSALSISSDRLDSSESSAKYEIPDSSGMFPSPDTPKFLVQYSTADLVTVMAQHLFTCFIWNIGSLLPKNLFNRGDININEFVKVESSRLFDLPSSIRSQSGRRLSHRQLTKFVNYAEKQGLGTTDDILLCIIPTLSLFDCLPNNVVLDYDQLAPKPFGNFRESEQREQCSRHINLLGCIVKNNGIGQDEYFALATVVNTMEFVYLTALHVEKANVCRALEKTHPSEFVDLLKRLFEYFGDSLRKLSPFYDLQRRRQTLQALFRDFEIGTETDDVWSSGWSEHEQDKSFMHKIGFTTWHRRVVEIKTGRWLNLRTLLVGVKDGTERDIFGWTPLHYAAARPGLKFTPKRKISEMGPPDSRLEITLNDNLRTNRWADKFRRSPVHIAAAAGNFNFLRILLPYLHNEAKLAICKGGIDEMSPLHLAAQGNHKNCKIDVNTQNPKQYSVQGNCKKCIVALLDNRPQVRKDTDAWKQSPIHTALAKQCYECTLSLLEGKNLDFSPEASDEFENPLLSYFDEKNEEHISVGRELLLKHYKKFQTPASGRDNILHHAIKFLGYFDLPLLLNLLEDSITSPKSDLQIDVANSWGQTPLYLAVSAKKSRLVRCLVMAGACPSLQDKDGISPMILACQRGDAESAMILLRNETYRGNESDSQGKTALHHATSSSEWRSDWYCLEIVQRLSDVMRTIDVQDHEDETPLQSAVKANRKDVCLVLLRSKASINLVDIGSLSALNQIVMSSLETEKKLRTRWEDQIRETATKHATEQDKNGDTAWHMAVHRENDDTLDWLMQNKAGIRIKNNSGATAFIEACRQDKCHKFIRKVVDTLNSKRRGSAASETSQHKAHMGIEELDSSNENSQSDGSIILDIDEGDTTFDQSPLAWACERGLKTVVEILLTSWSINIRRMATEFHNYTPLHFALANKKPTIVQLLLDHSEGSVIWNEPDDEGLTTIQFAMRNPDKDCLYRLLMHAKGKRGELSYDDPGAILKVCSGCDIRPSDWTWILDRIGLDETVEKGYIDEDNWTLTDVAWKYGHLDLQKHLRNKIDDSIKAPPPLRPSIFFGDYSGLSFTDSLVPGQTRTINMDVTFSGSFPTHFCFRTREPIGPNDSGFYFEVKLLHLPKNQVFMMGFCGTEIREGRAPGWDPGSWAYHTDDGGLYEGKDWAAIIADPEHICRENDVMGCGVDFGTGKGYRTRNGNLLSSGDAFHDDWLKNGKLYPCVGFRDDGDKDRLEVQIVLLGSRTQSFQNGLPRAGELQPIGET
ncbi:hypothetical protein FPOA_01819 [Fusarium poae]|uniref:B30.2/SPRY domain-containing protein n=1 Tax=Fusarium poae TaxID=36050 RepID=A0A1B8B581_FUSPO|nr:hypothetical protein FPOA_01819 [Fusarium poae]